jgi:hypothetical protein
MKTSDPSETIRAIFYSLHAGNLRLRKAPTVKIDQRVLLHVFGPAHLLKNSEPEKPAPIKPAVGRRNLRVIPPSPKKK